MKKTSLKLASVILGATLVTLLAACDGGSTPKGTGTVTPRPPVPEDQKIKPPGPPPMGTDSNQKTDKPAN